MSEDRIFSEIDEELRSERMQALWRQFGPWVIGAAVLIVVLVGANEGWRWYQNDISARSSDQFYSAFDLVDAGDLGGAQAALNETIADGAGQYPVLAQFSQAALLAEDGKIEEATAAYDALANSQEHQRVREVALYLAASLRVDAGDVAGVQARVGALITPDNPMRNVAREILGLAQYEAGERNAALQNFTNILSDPLTSPGLQRRARLYEAQLRAEGAEIPPPSSSIVISPVNE